MKAGSLFGPGTLVLGGGAVILIGLLVVGLFLPSEWSASAERAVAADAETVLTLLDAPEGWREWTTWPDSTQRSGPDRGTGARMSWEDRELGSGSFRIEEATASSVSYAVEVAGVGGSLITRGTITLIEGSTGTTIQWEERGDLGSNPLMGWWGLTMERAQSRELTKSLDQLAAALGETPTTTGSEPSR
ncbi:MAG: SRPBCC family protein [Gemmatimonadota bacterium]